jgi:glycosyltransferase involved in cell wall biosynthesis
MKIAIDARMMGPENTRGIGRYIEELIRAILAQLGDDRLVLVTRSADHPFVRHPSVETVVADIRWYTLAEQLAFRKKLYALDADLYHFPHWNIPWGFDRPFVVTIHDLLLLHEPSSAKISTRNFLIRLVKRFAYRRVLSFAIHYAKRILVPTEFVKNDVSLSFPKSVDHLTVTGEGMPPVTSGKSATQPPYLLYVGSAYPHKGLKDVFAVWDRVRAHHPELTFKIVGEMDVFMERLKKDTEKRSIPQIEFLGRVSDQTLSELYAGATAFIFPSHFEGFGLPPLEALAVGCPVISSDAGSLPEVLGQDGVFFFRAGDLDGILSAVMGVMGDPVAARVRAAQVALQLAKRHTWEQAAAKTLESYRRALK